jgi:hypothetical protein
MNWELYVVQGVDEDGYEEVIETTGSLKEARKLAEMTIKEVDTDLVECIIYKEDANGDLIEVEVVK